MPPAPLSYTTDTKTTKHLTRRSRIIQNYWRITEATLRSKATHPQIRLSLPPPNKIFISCPTVTHRATHVRASAPEHCKLSLKNPNNSSVVPRESLRILAVNLKDVVFPSLEIQDFSGVQIFSSCRHVLM